MQTKRYLALALYYLMLQHLPRTDRFCITWIRKLRSSVGRYIFDHYEGCNIEKGAYFGNGRGLSVGKSIRSWRKLPYSTTLPNRRLCYDGA